MSVKRCGGAYGARISRANQIAAACALAAYATKRLKFIFQDCIYTCPLSVIFSTYVYIIFHMFDCGSQGRKIIKTRAALLLGLSQKFLQGITHPNLRLVMLIVSLAITQDASLAVQSIDHLTVI